MSELFEVEKLETRVAKVRLRGKRNGGRLRVIRATTEGFWKGFPRKDAVGVGS